MKLNALLSLALLISSPVCAQADPMFLDGWAPGLAMVKNSRKVISDASIVAGTVRASSEQSWQPAVLVEYHWYFADGNGVCKVAPMQLGCLGLFAAAGTGSGGSQVLDLLGGGLMFGWGPPTTDTQLQKINLGVGVGRRFGVKVLGDGFEANAAPPAGETQVRFKQTDMTAAFIFLSIRFK